MAPCELVDWVCFAKMLFQTWDKKRQNFSSCLLIPLKGLMSNRVIWKANKENEHVSRWSDDSITVWKVVSISYISSQYCWYHEPWAVNQLYPLGHVWTSSKCDPLLIFRTISPTKQKGSLFSRQTVGVKGPTPEFCIRVSTLSSIVLHLCSLGGFS